MIQILLMAIESEEDRRLVEDFYLENRAKFKIIAYSIVKDEILADDCVHDVFATLIDMLERFKSFPPDDKIKYTVICVKNAAIAKCKDRNKYISLTRDSEEFDDGKEYDIADDSYDACEIVINQELKDKVRALIDALLTIYRDVMIFRFQYQLKGKEISDALHITEDAARQRLKRGKEMLRKRGGKELYDLFK